MNRYRVFFYWGNDLTLKTKVAKGTAWINGAGLHVEAAGEFRTLLARDISSATLFRLHRLGRVIRIEYQQGCLFLAVVRVMVGQFALINFLRTGRLQAEIAAIAEQAKPKSGGWPTQSPED